MGRDLLPLGAEPGPRLGKILKKLYELQLEAAFETREQGLRLAKELMKGKME